MVRIIHLFCLASAFCTLTLYAQNATNRPTEFQGSESPDKSLAVFQITDPGQRVSELRLVSLDPHSVNQSFPLSSRVQAWNIRQTRTSFIWSDDSAAVAFEITDGTNSEAYACARSKDGTFKAVNLTPTVRGSSLGVMGRPGTDFVRSEHRPMKWGIWSAQYGRIVIVRSRFWDKNGKRYTVSGPFMVTDKGEVGTQ
jgi:hypothetical protein